MITRKIIYRNLTLSKKFEFTEYVQKLNINSIVGGSHNEVIFKFDTAEKANSFMNAFYAQMKTVKGIVAEFVNDDLVLRYKTKIDYDFTNRNRQRRKG
jgi:hypothetical protein